MQLNLERVRANVGRATTEDLLDRLTVYGAQIEPAALDVIEAELRGRGISTADIRAHAERRDREVWRDASGEVAPCSFCPRPAVASQWGWHRLWSLVPLFPRVFRYCDAHRPVGQR